MFSNWVPCVSKAVLPTCTFILLTSHSLMKQLICTYYVIKYVLVAEDVLKRHRTHSSWPQEFGQGKVIKTDHHNATWSVPHERCEHYTAWMGRSQAARRRDVLWRLGRMRCVVRIHEEVGKSRKQFQQLPGGAGNVTQNIVYLQPPVLLDIASAAGIWCSLTIALPILWLSCTLRLLPPLGRPQPRCISFSTPLLLLRRGSHSLESGLPDSSLGVCPSLPNLSA